MAFVANKAIALEMNIILFVAPVASLVKLRRVDWLLVAAFAFGLSMLPEQKECSVAVMIKNRRIEILLDMACLAFSAITTLMTFLHVIALMACYTLLFHLVMNARPFVATVALDLPVLAFQQVVCFAVMVECAGLEGFFVMA